MTSTIREALRDALDRPRTMLELSKLLHQPEKELVEHLSHLRRSLPARGARLVVEPATCRACGHVFDDRERLTRPSRCPVCKKERIEPPRFSVQED